MTAKKNSTKKEPRKLQAPSYRSFRLQKTIKKTADKPAIPNSFKLFRGALGILRQNWKPFLGIIFIYGLLNVLLVQSFNGSDLSKIKTILEGFSDGQWSSLLSSFTLFIYMIGSSGNVNSQVAGAYQLTLTLVTSLALIWTLRQVYAGNKVRIRDGFYFGMSPFITFLLVLIAVTIQLVPLILGSFLYNLASSTGIAVGGIEMTLWAIIFFLLGVTSLYMICSSIFALYIVCLPDMQPMTALRSARDIVRYRRWEIMRKILFLPLILLVLAVVIIVPLIYFVTPVASVIFFILSMIVLPVTHSYMYRLYRELL